LHALASNGKAEIAIRLCCAFVSAGSPSERAQKKNINFLRELLKGYVLKIGRNDRAPPIRMTAKGQLVPSLASLAGALTGIIAVGLVASHFSLPILIAPFGASVVLLFSVYDSPLAQPRNTIFGHVMSGLIGATAALIHVTYFAGGEKYVLEAISVAVSIFAMQILRLTHPPAGATAFLASTAITDVDSLLRFIIPVVIGALILVALAITFNNMIPKRRYPVYW
jgi:CBS-domain-containing membrane protein